jgi:hypothetical protein
MSYIKQTWVDRAVEFFRRFSVEEDSSGNLTLTEEPGIVTSEGTPLDATRLNHIEDGIEEVSNNLNLVQSAIGNLKVINAGVDPGVVITHTLLSNELYLLVIGRDDGLYVISAFGLSAYLTPVVPLSGTGTVSVSGLTLTVDFETRTRPYVLLRLS